MTEKVQVEYKGLIATIIINEAFQEVLDHMRTPEGKDKMLSVMAAIEKTGEKVRAGEEITEKERQNLADDLGIYYAYELSEGRGQGAKIQ